ncbi:imidazoleglycerol-phosphate dehydratase HisB [Methanogenium organophilum]|uniref:Imidazoleglycerol-phosphate dehydratase n=1 Tax=Methanogenium organophilum TaxID=2199 RepID=A0A9X9T8M9_METOG|nr:imidazoleglycerol-phosphate dehydratase HisB [Methanogenium organophilum]WAI01855.1 imidazoleglycerol-phosphate dehydratase HisB [Methanogenium organophilum]
MRQAEITRKTNETDITITVDLDTEGTIAIDTGIPFFDHMLESCARHGRFGLTVKAMGDLEIDCHHTIEDTAIVLGEALREALGEKRGIQRFAHMAVPMDEAIAVVTLDLGGRGYLVYDAAFSPNGFGKIPADIFEHFFYSLCIKAGITAHMKATGRNDHHICEALFKTFGVAFRMASEELPGRTDIPSTKGII